MWEGEGSVCVWLIGVDHPFHDGGHGLVFYAELAEHVVALGAVVHGVGHDMGEDAAGGEGVGLVAAFSVDDGFEWICESGLFEG